MNGVVDAWFVSKWAVKEKFEYDLVIVDNGVTNRFNNINKNNYYRYNLMLNHTILLQQMVDNDTILFPSLH